MMKSKSFEKAFIFLICVGVLNFIAIKLHLYWTMHYFDSLVHFMAGISVGFASLWLFSLLFLRDKPPLTSIEVFIVSILGSFVVGVVWEVFEVINGITFLSDGIRYVTDTSSDLLMDILGACVAALFTRYSTQ